MSKQLNKVIDTIAGTKPGLPRGNRWPVFTDRIRAIIRNKDIMKPITIELGLTNHCNANCYLCSTGQLMNKNKKHFISIKKIKKLFTILKKNDIKAIRFTISEPLTHPNFLEICRLGEKAGFNMELITNGLALNEKLARELVKIKKLAIIRVSLNATSPDVYSKFFGVSETAFYARLKNLRDLVKAKVGAGRKDLLVGANYIIDNTNFHQVAELPNFFKTLIGRRKPSPINFIAIRPAVCYKNNANYLNPQQTKKSYELIANRVKPALKKLGIFCYVNQRRFQKYVLNKTNANCFYGSSAVGTVLSNGDYYWCCELAVISKGFSYLGNVFLEDFEKILKRRRKSYNCYNGKGCIDLCLHAHRMELIDDVKKLSKPEQDKLFAWLETFKNSKIIKKDLPLISLV